MRKTSPKVEYELASCIPVGNGHAGWVESLRPPPRRNRDFLWLLGGVH